MQKAYKWAWVIIALLLIAVLAFRIVYPLVAIKQHCQFTHLMSHYDAYECTVKTTANYYYKGNL